MKKNFFGIFILGLTVAFNQTAICQDAYKVKKLTTPIEFDGKPFEEAWNGCEYNPMVMFKPNFGAEPNEISIVMLTYDDQYFWVGAKLLMRDASQIAITSRKRDDQPRSPDHFSILIDGYNDKENASLFMTNPEGTRIDMSIGNDAAGGSNNMSWNTFWDVKSSRDDKGWYIEMRIPFSSLRFKSVNNLTRMGFIIKRCYTSSTEIDTYPATDPKYGGVAFMKPSLAAEIEFEGIQPKNPFYISPYVITGTSRDWVLNSDETDYVPKDNPTFNAGLDMKYNFKSNLTLDLTANTDFAQVEADDQQVNLTRYSLFFPEKRMFFQERSDIFNYSLGGNANLFYSRNIGLSKGESVRIYGGARLVGRLGKWDLGLMDMQTEEHSGTPAENFGVLRLRRQVINANSYVGGMFTSRIGFNGNQNFAYGLDALFRVFGVDYLELKAAQTYDDKIENDLGSLNPMFVSASWERRKSRGLGYSLKYSYSGEEFNPGIGFVNMGSLQGFTGNILYGWFPSAKSKVYTVTPSVTASRYTRLTDNGLESVSVKPSLKISMKSNFAYDISLEYQKEGVLFNFPLSDTVKVYAGDYEFTNVSLGFQTPMSKPFYVILNFTTGGFYNGTSQSFSLTPYVDLSRSFQLSGLYQYNHIALPGQKKLDIHIARLKLVYMYNTKLSVSAYVQFTNSTNNLVSNLRLRYNPREGNDFYLVFNDLREISKKEYVPELPDYYTRTILLKYTHTFRL
jgi:hypothetical protein